MSTLFKTCQRNQYYFAGYGIFIAVLCFYCAVFTKTYGFLLINPLHDSLLDYFFILFTNLGNGFFVIGLMIFFVIRKKSGWSLQIGVSFLVSGIITQLLKQSIHSPRPLQLFGPNTIHYIYGVTRVGFSSFPSGHSTTIFGLTTLLCLYFPGRRSGILFLVIAILAGFSRIYLSQHFPVDVLAGSLIGVTVSLLTYSLIPLPAAEKKPQNTEMEAQSINLW